MDASLKDWLDARVDQYNRPQFISSDPIGIPHRYSHKEDIEISGFLTASIAWGQRVSIIKNARRLMERMDHSPHDFILNHRAADRRRFEGFVHRTFNYDDLVFFLASLQRIYKHQGGLESSFAIRAGEYNMKNALMRFRRDFFALEHLRRTEKHVSNPAKNSSCKRLNMFLRWMVRSDQRGVDFGLWPGIPPSRLSCPLDVHTGNTARKLGILHRRQNDWKAVEELDAALRAMDPEDPVKYDFALFGTGVFEK